MKIRVSCCWGVEGSPPHWVGDIPWRSRRRVSGAVSSALRSGVPPPEGGGGGRCNRTGGLPFLPEEVEARTVFPLRTGHADAGHWNPVPPDSVVGGLYQSDVSSTLHVLTGT